MQRSFFVISLMAALVILGFAIREPVIPVSAQEPGITPTFDPLIEPLLPAHPTEFELGRNLYWHWCMTCHGDRGQGLTDEFRKTWVKDHQNCWARGCHAGHNNDQGFPIPTVVPLIIGDGHLARFATLQELFDFLKTTHPPQHPGILKDDEYHAIAVYVFTQNDRSLATETPAPRPSPTLFPSATPVPTTTLKSLLPTSAQSQWFYVFLFGLALAFLVWLLCKFCIVKNDSE